MELKTHVSQKVLRFLLRRSGGNVDAAREALQDTWVAVLRSYRTFNHKSTYFTWICKIALNKLADYYRGQVRHRSRVFVPTIDKFNEIINPEISPVEKLSLDELKITVNQCLNMLPAEYRQLLQLRYYERLSLRNISLSLKIPIRSIEGKLYRAKKMLANVIIKAP